LFADDVSIDVEFALDAEFTVDRSVFLEFYSALDSIWVNQHMHRIVHFLQSLYLLLDKLGSLDSFSYLGLVREVFLSREGLVQSISVIYVSERVLSAKKEEILDGQDGLKRVSTHLYIFL
jgi:hypothetical protein